MESRLLPDIVVAQSPAVLQLLSREDQSLLLRRDTLFILDLGLYILDRVIGLHVQSDRLSRQRLDENLHGATPQSQHQMERGLFLDVVVAEGPAVLQLFTGKDQPLLLGRNPLFVLDLGLD